MDQMITSDLATFPRISVGKSQAPLRTPEGFDELAAEFESATGWVLQFNESGSSRRSHQIKGNDSIPFGNISICDMSAKWPADKNTASRQVCDRMAERISQVFAQRQLAQLRLNESSKEVSPFEIEILTRLGGIRKVDHERELSELLVGLLKSCCEFAGGWAAAICLLDESTQNLVTRFAVGTDGFQGATRQLGDAIADVEALCGAAIVMNDSESVNTWQSPVDCQSAVCLPISSATTLLGTLWVFAAQEQDYSDETLNVLEIVSGRVAAELELARAWQDVVSSGVREVVDEAASAAAAATGFVAENTGEVEELSTEQANFTETCAQPPFAGWSVELGKGEGLATWRVTSDEQIIAVIAGAEDDQMRQEILVALECSSEQGYCDASELLAEICQTVDGQRAIVAVIDPLIGEVQLAQSGNDSKASLVSRDGNVNCITRSHACFMCRGQSLQLGASRLADGETASLTFRRN